MVGDPDAACIRGQLAEDMIQQNRLAAAGTADDGNHLAAHDRQVDTAQDLMVAESAVQVLDLDFDRRFGIGLAVTVAARVHDDEVPNRPTGDPQGFAMTEPIILDRPASRKGDGRVLPYSGLPAMIHSPPSPGGPKWWRGGR